VKEGYGIHDTATAWSITQADHRVKDR
jgi:hypothetical protein